MGKWRGPPHEEIPRCRARTRTGGLCGHFSMPNGKCRYHGGKSTGAKQPRTKHGLYTKSAIDEQRMLRKLLSGAKQLSIKNPKLDY